MMGVIGAVLGFLLKAIGILLLLLLTVLVIVLVTPIKIGVIYPELTVYVKWNGIKYTLLPAKKKGEKAEREEKPQKAKSETAEKQEKKRETAESTAKGGKKPKKKKEGFAKKLTVDKIKAIIRIVLSLSKKLLKAITFEQLYAVITVADEDKAKMAEDYGKLCVLLVGVQPVLESVFTIKDQHINAGLDFSKSETTVACDVIMYVRPVILLTAAVTALIKIKKEGII